MGRERYFHHSPVELMNRSGATTFPLHCVSTMK
jgi:hypothetical protein